MYCRKAVGNAPKKVDRVQIKKTTFVRTLNKMALVALKLSVIYENFVQPIFCSKLSNPLCIISYHSVARLKVITAMDLY